MKHFLIIKLIFFKLSLNNLILSRKTIEKIKIQTLVNLLIIQKKKPFINIDDKNVYFWNGALVISEATFTKTSVPIWYIDRTR